MAAFLEKLRLKKGESFHIGVFQDNLEKCTWHYHDHYEISFITEGMGKRIVADSMDEFQPGDLALIGPNLPHVWIAERELLLPTNRSLEMVVLQFDRTVVPGQMLLLPEMQFIKRALDFAERGIQITGQTLNEVSEIMLRLPYLKSFDRMIAFYMLMEITGKSTTNRALASEEFLKKRFSSTDKRIMAIHDYLMQHYRDEVDLASLSDLVNMARGSLCRFFKANTGVTLFDYLNRLKTELACKLLMDSDLSVLDVCFDSGFNNLSHFNKQFKKITHMTPTQYRRQFLHLAG